MYLFGTDHVGPCPSEGDSIARIIAFCAPTHLQVLPSIIGNRSPLQRSVSRHTDRVRVIRAGDEIFAHYGSDYEGLRTYQPGEAAVLLKRDIPFEQYPSQIFGVSLPGDAIFRD